jgi:undecaprenyl-diphosphatase
VPSLVDLDLRALLAVYDADSGTLRPLMVAFTVLGSGWTALALVPMAIHRPTRRFATALALAVLAQATIVWCIKAAVGRVRPWIALGFPPPLGAPRDGSFPSGHAAGSFCVAAFLAVALPDCWPASPRGARRVVGITAVLAAFIASSRVYLGAHFPGDVLCGALLGSAVGAGAGRALVGATSARGREGPVERGPESG